MKDEVNKALTNISFDIYSDVICPWCYVGKRRLERALGELKHSLRATITWRPFQLNPTMPKDGMDRREYLEAKFGSLDAVRRLEEHVREAGRSEDISFAFDKILRTPNTFLAHRLIWMAGQRGLQDVIIDRLFRGYFEEGADIGSASTLARLAQDAGINAEQFLQGNEGIPEVRAEEAAGHRLGIRGVPYFVLNRVHSISGAQPVEQFVSTIRTAQAKQDAGLEAKR